VSFAGVLEGGLNLVPPALCLLGLGVLVIGIWPRGAVTAVYAMLAWSFLIEVIGGALNLSHWVLDTSVLHQMAAAPAVSPDWSSAAGLVGIGATAALLGGVAFGRRDLAGE
jgi:ABC-2 type transport system permease protein